MQFTVKVDFFTDIITNSSSVVYSQANGVETIHQFLNDVLKEFGVEKKSEDVFNISIIPDMDRVTDWVSDGNLDDEEFNKQLNELDYNEGYTLAESKIKELLQDNYDFSDAFDYGYEESSYVITTKDGEDTKLGRKVEGLFSHEGSYDG